MLILRWCLSVTYHLFVYFFVCFYICIWFLNSIQINSLKLCTYTNDECEQYWIRKIKLKSFFIGMFIFIYLFFVLLLNVWMNSIVMNEFWIGFNVSLIAYENRNNEIALIISFTIIIISFFIFKREGKIEN